MGTTLQGKKIKDTYQSLIKVTDNGQAGSSAKQLSDGAGNDFGLYIDTDGVVGIGAGASYSLDVSSKNDGVALPVGTTANRPTGTNGLIRYNTTTSRLEYYDGAFKKIASESYVNTEINNILDSAPAALDTLNEIAAALNNDDDFYNTITGLINAKQNTLTAGTGIDITSDTISTDLTAGSGISINGSTISADLTGLVDTGAIQSDAVTAPKIAEFNDGLTADTAGDILIADGTDFNNQTIGGDATLASDGTLTIAANAVEASMIEDNVQLDGTESLGVPAGTTAQRPIGTAGQFRYNTTTNEFEGYTTAWGSIGGGSTNFVVNTFDGDGSTVAFTLTNTIANENNLQVFIDGVYQSKSNYSTSGQVITFTTAPATGTDNIEITHAVAVGGTPEIEVDTFDGDDSTTGFTLTTEPVTKNNLQIYIDGVYQAKANYSVSGTTLTFTTAPATGTNNIEVTHIKLS